MSERPVHLDGDPNHMRGSHQTDGVLGWPCLSVLFRPMDLQSQLDAIHREINRHQEVQRAGDMEIARVGEAASRGAAVDPHGYLPGLHNDLMFQSAYDAAAHSLATVGMLAPFIETVFGRYFSALRETPIADRLLDPAHPRSKMKKDPWDCHYRTTGKKGLAEGIRELSEATALDDSLPRDTHTLLSALFLYRNEVLHNGLEWPDDRLREFTERVKTESSWAGWFDQGTTDGKPWMFCMTESFVSLCLTKMDGILDALEKHLQGRCNDPECSAWWLEVLKR